MLQYIGKRFVHCFVIASIIFGCSVQAATPSFKEDLDDFEEIYLLSNQHSAPAVLDAPVILWQNEDLSQTVLTAHGAVDDFEKLILKTNPAFILQHLEYSLCSVRPVLFERQTPNFHQARAPPIII
ncbi:MULTISPECIES: hypothetical protein [unclassified Polynucleobacter]|uniref:hypothetical protein n=1 Tax=unclassified Polynucleobacter TaxID=2640945 RepID=UPI002572E133|nr:MULTISPECIES: hypothetical protein [unclassified Polynucleobacter]BEI37017.1 hypothetical protein PHIN7_07410 [Polynucleobacter sp. HIN7]BEI40802.1 hypothetical protein PHIN9_07330 [Polynucleobacter sp. HIN9]